MVDGTTPTNHRAAQRQHDTVPQPRDDNRRARNGRGQLRYTGDHRDGNLEQRRRAADPNHRERNPGHPGDGNHVIQWTARDGSNEVSAFQTVTVGPRIESNVSFLVDNRARVTNASGVLAAISNRGSGQTQVGYDARTGGIVSLGPVTALDRATIGGDIFSGSTITAPHATVNGNQFQFASVILPALPSLPSFPPATGGDITVNSGTQTRGPGSYNVATLNGGTLTLTGSGDYYFRTLTINNGATIRVAANSRVFVQNSLAYRSPFRPPTGSTVQTVYLGFAGTSVTMEAPYNGTMVAPNATVQFGTGAGLTFNGSFFAGTIEVRRRACWCACERRAYRDAGRRSVGRGASLGLVLQRRGRGACRRSVQPAREQRSGAVPVGGVYGLGSAMEDPAGAAGV